jgi:protein MpaA
VEGREIDVFSFSRGRKTILLMAGVHGDEKRGVRVVRSILKRLRREFQASGLKSQGPETPNLQPETRNLKPATCNAKPAPPAVAPGVRVVVMPLVNPDGYAAGTRTNARGVDINRNFPTKDFGSDEDRPGGTEAASEPETRAILDVVSRFKPYLIISLHTSLACVNYNGDSAVEVAERMSAVCGLPVKDDIGYPCPGSMGTYCGWERALPVITLELPPDGTDLAPVERAVLGILGVE